MSIGGSSAEQQIFRPNGFLNRVLHDRTGNTLVIMAIALIPLTALGGSAVDTARLYVVKSRLQQACDAGVLAGRKFMVDSTNNSLDPAVTQQARNFFNNNLVDGWMGTSAKTFQPVKTAGNRVSANATVLVPMTITKIIGAPDVTLSTTCEARLDIADTDVMFVLDTTGSMACLPEDDDSACSSYVNANTAQAFNRPSNPTADITPGYVNSVGYRVPEKPSSRIAALRTAVVDFYDTIEAAKQPTTRMRYAFVPYASSVNIGGSIRAVNMNYLVGSAGPNDRASYQSRRVSGDYEISRTTSDTNRNQSSCGAGVTTTRNPATPLTYASNGTATLTSQEWINGVCRNVTRTLGPTWTYERLSHSVSDYITNASAITPTRIPAASSAWVGCIEENDSSATGQTTFDANNPPPSLNPDLVPSGATRWIPMWPEVTHQRFYRFWRGPQATTDTIQTNGDDTNTAPNMAEVRMQQSGNFACGKPAQRLKEMTREQLQSYVTASDFVPLGGTYHDTGMLWGLRLLSRTGAFANDNAAQGARGLPKRVIVFLTDGAMSASANSYTMYGMETWDRRVSNGDTANLTAYHNARFRELCQRARAASIDVWTIALGTASTNDLRTCATTPDQALATTSGAGLSDAFRRIAKAVALLRLSQ